MFVDGKACNMLNVSKLCTKEVYNLHVSAFKYSLPDLHKSFPPLNHVKLAVTHKFKLTFIQHTAKYPQSLTHMLSLDEIRCRQLPSFCIHNRYQYCSFRQLIDRWSHCVQDQLSPAFD